MDGVGCERRRRPSTGAAATWAAVLSSSHYPHAPMRRLLAVVSLLVAPATLAQTLPPNPYPPTPGADRLRAAIQRYEMNATSLVRNVPFRSVGPAVMSGRVVDVDVNPADPLEFYVAYATGGVWKTVNGGQSFTSVFDHEAVIFVGDIAVDWARGQRLWVGTGEANASRSSYAGVGVFVSDAKGDFWEHRGLEDSHHIGRILLDPESRDGALVAALGPLYSDGGQRGVFKTTDGGATWRNTLPLVGNVGAVDLARDPSNPNVVYAATWERTRRAWDFQEAGAGSGVYKSTDNGETWMRLTLDGGFPSGSGTGRIGVDVGPGGVVYAFVDNNDPKPESTPALRPGQTPPLTRERLRTMTRADFLALTPQQLTQSLDDNGFPSAYTATSVLEDVRSGRLEPKALVEYLEDANANLFNKPVKGAELYRSDDGGATWRKTHEGTLDGLNFSYGYYFSNVRVDPQNADRVYLVAFHVVRSDDGGKTFTSLAADNVHVDHHALWVSPSRAGHLVNGNDGGVNVSYDDGQTWFKANTPAVGQFYFVQTDNAEPYNVYGGLQDNGVWVGPSTYTPSRSWLEEGRYPYRRINGGDGMQVMVDDRDGGAPTVYSGYQFGFYQRRTGEGRAEAVRPKHTLGERPPRFNWQTPILLSPHNRDVLYVGADKLYRSMDRGETFTALSDDLTNGGRSGDVPYGTLTAIDESPKRFGYLVTGSDDGRVSLSRDGGYSWTDISAGLPPSLWVSEVVASRHVDGRLYVALNGYRWDHMDAYVYRSDDHGATWTRIAADLPKEPVNALVEDTYNPDHLYLGTDAGVWFSLDGGQTTMPFANGLPTAPVHDLKIQDRERDLVVGTHGRSIYIADLGLVQNLTPAVLAERVHVFGIGDLIRSPRWGTKGNPWDEANRPKTTLGYWAKDSGPATITVADSAGTVLARLDDSADRGINFVPYDATVDELLLATPALRDRYRPADDGRRYLVPGRYRVTVTMGSASDAVALEIKVPPPRPSRPLDPEAHEREEEG